MMAKFKKGDRVRCVKPDYGKDRIYKIGELVTVDECSHLVFRSDGSFFYTDHWELATPSPTPDTVTIGGVEYVRKPKPEHVWAWGQWARVNGAQPRYEGEYVFIVGALDDGFVPFTSPKELSGTPVKWIGAEYLTYISTATVPE